MSHSRSLSLALCLLAACRVGVRTDAPASSAPPSTPAQAEIPLDGSSGWDASLVLDQPGVGIWTVGVLKVFEQYGAREIVALDDLGRFHALWSYSGKWTPVSTVHDGKWLGGIVEADLDPRIDGDEFYTGSANGNLYQVTTPHETFLDCRLIGVLPGHEIHTLVGGELDLAHDGPELIAFTRPGKLVRLSARLGGAPGGSADGITGARDGFDVTVLSELPGRVRDALVLPGGASPPEIVTAGRHGRVEVLRLDRDGPRWTTIHEVPMGVGRVALAPARAGGATVLYSTCDDGRVFRHEREGDAWRNELIYAGPQGLRGIAAGRFDADANVETIAVFGYSKEVELLTRRAGGWQRETLFVDRDKGHWLCAGELDGRNATDELVASGYSGRVVLLARPPGYGLPGVLVR
ncbi:MAG: hypothetical protein IT453_22015 [Planctomycetes bacterium]|nr:hypothetical protein [Planctomycetota bacterium]